MTPIRKIKVLVVDDSALIRDILTQGLAKDDGIEVVGSAPDPYVARDKILQLKPDVLTLDVEMPRMDGVEFLRKLMPQHPLPVVIVSALTERGAQITLDALAAGAVDFLTKPKADMAKGLQMMLEELRTKVKIASTANVSAWKHTRTETRSIVKVGATELRRSTDKVIVIGASAGGTEAIREVLIRLPADIPGIVITQHMPAGFTKLFADRLNELCQIEVKEAQTGDRIMPGRALIAPGGMHMRVLRSGGIYQVDCRPGPLVSGHCPSVEVMMQSAAESVKTNAIAVMLTGMGHDGCTGMKAMRDAGARTLAQDEATCVVFGMPKEAWKLGAVEKLLPLDRIPEEIVRLLTANAVGAPS